MKDKNMIFKKLHILQKKMLNEILDIHDLGLYIADSCGYKSSYGKRKLYAFIKEILDDGKYGDLSDDKQLNDIREEYIRYKNEKI